MKRVLAFWSLNGKLTKDELKKQIDDFKSVGYGGFFLHARGGLETEYFSNEWFEMLRFAAEYGYKAGLEAYLYDENGWPSGYAGGRVPAKSKSYRQSYMEFVPLKEKNAGFSECETIAEIPNENLAVVRKYNEYYTNLLEKNAVEEFINCTYERYKTELGDLFGKEIKGIFTDEPQLSNYGYPVYDGLFEDFENKYGYSLKDNLIFIHKGDEFNGVRYDYRKLIAEKYAETYTGMLGAWCEKNGIAFTGHMAAEDGLYFQSQTQIDVMPNYLNFTVPGIDVLGNKLPSITLLKQVSTVAEQFGKKEVISETFGTSGHSATPKELSDIWFYEAMYGVNRACLHLSAYSLEGRRKRDYPPDFSRNLEYFSLLGGFFEGIDKLGKLAETGKRITDILVMNPIGTFFGKYANRRKSPPAGKCSYEDKLSENGVTEDLSEVSVNYVALQEILAETGFDYHIGDELVLNGRASVKNGRLYVGEYDYGVVIIPFGAILNGETTELLEKFACGGGKLLFAVKLPKDISGKNTYVTLYEKGLAHPLSIKKDRFITAMRCYEITPPVTVFDSKTRLPESELIVTSRRTSRGKIVFLYNKLNCKKTLFLRDKGHELHFTLGERENAAVILEEEKSIYYPLSGKIEPLYNEIRKTKEETIKSKAAFSVCGENVLPVDVCDGFINGEKIASGYFLDVNEKIYSAILAKGRGKVRAEYRFFAESLPEKLYVVAETTEELTGVYLNGCKLSLSNKSFLSFARTFDAENNAVIGENVISLEYEIDASALKPEISAFETESNVFCRKTEMESVYVFGNFIVKNDGLTRERRGKRFLVTNETVIKNGIASAPEEAPFYKGKFSYEFVFEYRENEKADKTVLSINVNYPVLEFDLNGKKYVGYSGEIDVTGVIENGKNRLTVTAHTGNRNLMGPHRYFDCDTEYVGPATFKGVRGWEDNFNRNTPYPLVPEITFTRGRSVQAFYLDDEITITTYEEK